MQPAQTDIDHHQNEWNKLVLVTKWAIGGVALIMILMWLFLA